nr:phosphatidylinositol N-acetylglucosaminyltransferase subunit P [Leptinotarsa decemlineata]
MPEHTPAPTPSRAVYGFVMYLSFRIFFIIYVIWAVIPEEWFVSIGITFLPQRYWAVAVPVYFLTVLTIFAFVIYPGFGLYMTPNVDDLRTITDHFGKKLRHNSDILTHNQSNSTKCVCKNKDNCSKSYYENISRTSINEYIPPVQDLKMWYVSDSLYLK